MSTSTNLIAVYAATQATYTHRVATPPPPQTATNPASNPAAVVELSTQAQSELSPTSVLTISEERHLQALQSNIRSINHNFFDSSRFFRTGGDINYALGDRRASQEAYMLSRINLPQADKDRMMAMDENDPERLQIMLDRINAILADQSLATPTPRPSAQDVASNPRVAQTAERLGLTQEQVMAMNNEIMRLWDEAIRGLTEISFERQVEISEVISAAMQEMFLRFRSDTTHV